MFPGSYPLEELESALSRIAVEDPGALIDELGSDDRGLTRVIKRILPPGTSLLLVIDQFEELFTLTREEADRDRLLQGLVDLVRDERSETRVVLTLRADFFDRPLQYAEFGELIKAGTLALTTPGPDHLMEAIERPAKEVGATWEIGLPETIRDDVERSPGMLPLLQYSLTELFADRQGTQLTHAAYRANGGVVGALSSRADEVYDRLDEAGRDLARQICLRLVTVEPTGEVTRHRARLPELNALGDPAAVKKVLDSFGAARLLVFDRDPISRSPTVEVAHEALLSRWPRLAGWIDEAEEDLLLHRRLQDAVDEWEGRDRKDEYLLGGGRLAQFETWADSTDLTLGPSETEYLQASGDVAERQRSRRRRIRNMVTAGFGVAAAVAGMFAFSAARSSEVAHARELGASAINVLDEDSELSVLLALQAASIANPPFESVAALHESVAAQKKIFTYRWPEDRTTGGIEAKISPDGTLLVASGGTNYVEVVDIDSGARLWSREFPQDTFAHAAFSPDGSAVVTAVGWVGEADEVAPSLQRSQLGVHRLESRSGRLIDSIDLGPCGTVAAPDVLTVVGPGAGSHLLTQVPPGPDCTPPVAEGTDDSESLPVVILDLATGDAEQVASTSFVQATPDGHTLAVEMAREVDGEKEAYTQVLRRVTGEVLAELPGSPFGISADGRALLTDYGDLATWDLSEGQPDLPLTTLGFSFDSWLSPDGALVARMEGTSIELVDSRSGEVERLLRTGLGSNHDISFNTESSRVLINEGFSNAAVVFDLLRPAELDDVQLCSSMLGQTGQVEVAGQWTSVFAGCPAFNDQYLIDSESLDVVSIIENEGGLRSALSPDGRLVATQSARQATRDGEEVTLFGQVVLSDTTTGKIVRTMEGLCEWDEHEPGPGCAGFFPAIPFPDWPWDLEFSPDGSMLAMGGQNSEAAVVWNTNTGELLGTPTAPGSDHDWVFTAGFSPDGDRMAASYGPAPKELWLFSTEDWQALAQYVAPATSETSEAPSDNLLFTPDGKTLIGTDFYNFGASRIVFMDGSTLEHLHEIQDAHDGGVLDLALNGDGTLLASAGYDGVVRVWDVASRALLHEIPVSQGEPGVGGVDFIDQDGHLLVTANATGELRKVTIDTDELLDIARHRITRGFTETECNTYRIDPCPTLEEIRAG
jgi:WD40 repeat protein